MPEFFYSARNEQGKRFAGKLEAQTQTEALALLSERYAIVTRLERRAKRGILRTALRSAVKGEDLLGFSQTLAAMLDGGITVKRALETIYGDTENRTLRQAIMDLSTQIGQGTPLSQALAAHPTIFDEFFTKMVRAGENSGELPEMLRRVSEYVEKTEALKDQVKAALTYPFIVIVFAGLMMTVMLTFGIPYLNDLYAGLNMTLPLPTRIMVAVGTFLNNNLWFLLLLVFAAVYGTRSFLLSDSGQRIVDGLKLRLPVFGDFFRTLYTARFSRTLALLYSSGVPVLHALELTGQSVGNTVVAASVEKAQASIEAGESLSDCLRANPYFLDAAIGMVAAGEESGRLDAMLRKVADFYEAKVYVRLEALTSTVEPLIMVGVGCMVGVMVLTLGLPFMTLASAFGG